MRTFLINTRINRFFSLLTIALLATSCNGQNGAQKSAQTMKEFPEMRMPPRDTTTLSTFSNYKPSARFFKDKNHVYTRQLSVIEGPVPAGFEVIAYALIKDKDHVYYSKNGEWEMAAHVDAPSLRLLGKKYDYHLLKDKHHVYLFRETGDKGFQIIENANPLHFEQIWNNVYADENRLYNSEGKPLTSFTDTPTKKVFDMRDYLGTTPGKLSQISIVKSKMEHLGHGVFTDGTEVFSLEQENVFKNADVESFTLINEAYAKDKNTVYYGGGPVSDLDPQSFELFPFRESSPYVEARDNPYETISSYRSHKSSGYMKDKSQIYWNREILKGADRKTFQVLSANYAKDKKRVYFQASVVKGADAESFTIRKDKDGKPAIAVDKKHIYFLGKKMKGASPRDIIEITGADSWLDNAHWYKMIFSEGIGRRLIKEERIKASNLPMEGYYYILEGKVYYRVRGVYAKGLEISRADAESFMALNERYAKDKNHVYYEGKAIECWLYTGKDGERHSCTREAFDLAQKIYKQKISNEEMYAYLEILTGIQPSREDERDVSQLTQLARLLVQDMGGAEIEKYCLDPNTVQVFLSGNDGKDKRYYFRNESIYATRSKQSDAFDFESLESIGTSWGPYKDKNHVYNDDMDIIIGVDPQTIEPVYWPKEK